MSNPIIVPEWAKAVCDIVTPAATDKTPLSKRIESGDVKPDASLLYELGISPTELGERTTKLNTNVIDKFSSKSPKNFVSVVELEACKTIVDLMNLIYSRL